MGAGPSAARRTGDSASGCAGTRVVFSLASGGAGRTSCAACCTGAGPACRPGMAAASRPGAAGAGPGSGGLAWPVELLPGDGSSSIRDTTRGLRVGGGAASPVRGASPVHGASIVARWTEPGVDCASCLASHRERISAKEGRGRGSWLSWPGASKEGSALPCCLASHRARISAREGRGGGSSCPSSSVSGQEPDASGLGSTGSTAISGASCTGRPARARPALSWSPTSSGWDPYFPPASGKRAAISPAKRANVSGSTELMAGRRTCSRPAARCTMRVVCPAVRVAAGPGFSPSPDPPLAGSQRRTQGDSARRTHCALEAREWLRSPAGSFSSTGNSRSLAGT